MFSAFFIFTWFTFNIVLTVTDTLYEGDSCVFNNGERGYCRLLKNCSLAIDNLKKFIYPQHCSFKGREPIVCCMENTSTDTFEKTSSRSRIPGKISETKCEEYENYYNYKQYVNHGKPVLDRSDFPHMVVVGFQEENEPTIKWGCGGAIVSESYILTAAHCILNRVGPPKFIMTGMLSLTDSDGIIKNITKTIVHPDYKPPANYHDIGLLKVEPKIALNDLSRPICLTTSKDIPSSRAAVSGWGKTEIVGPLSQTLLFVELEVFNQSDCDQIYKGSPKTPQGINYSIMICAGSYREVKDVCEGDSGGPLVMTRALGYPKRIYGIGIVSFGKPCGLRTQWPSVYTRISTYVKWIEDIVWPEE